MRCVFGQAFYLACNGTHHLKKGTGRTVQLQRRGKASVAKAPRSRNCQCSKDTCAQKVSGGRTDPSPKYRWKVHG